MNVLITGIAGGIGSTLALQLKRKGYKVIGVDNFNNGYYKNLFDEGEEVCHKFYDRDIRDNISIQLIMNDEKIDVVIHLAAITSLPIAESDPKETIDVNVAGTASILDSVRKSKVKKTIIASTSAIYENSINTPFVEREPVYPKLIYPLSKKMMEDLIESYKINYGLNIVTLRFFNVFGPRQDIHRETPPLLNYITKCISEKNPATFYSDGKQQRDYVYVDDVTDMITLCINVPESSGETFNVCTGTLTSVKDIVGYAEKAFGEFEYKFIPAEKYWGSYNSLHEKPYPLKSEVIVKEVNKFAIGSYQHAKKILGWNPNTNIEKLMIGTFKEGLKRFKYEK